LERHQPRLALITDNTDRTVAGAVGAQMADLVASIDAPQVPPREPPQAALDVVEVYPYVDYMKYFLPGSVALAIFMTAMIGGGLLFIDDKSRGLHEGYMVTPITKWELILGFNLSGVIKAMLAGETVLVLGAVVAGVPNFFQPARLLELTLMVALTSVALIGMMFFIMARISDPLVPRAIFGVLNTLLFFPSGAVYPIAGFPRWLRLLSNCDPFTYAVHGFRTLLLKNVGITAISTDIFALVLTSVVVLTGATLLFRRTL
jgi:ABC-2 type transport system permease protein